MTVSDLIKNKIFSSNISGSMIFIRFDTDFGATFLLFKGGPGWYSREVTHKEYPKMNGVKNY